MITKAFVWTLLFSGAAGMILVNFATANMFVTPRYVATCGFFVTITSPENKTYPDGDILLSFTVDLFVSKYYAFETISLCTYELNGKKVNFSPNQTRSGDSICCETTLKGIPEGSYNLAITVQAYFVYTPMEMSYTTEGFSATTSFTIKGTPPSITLLTTQNKTYNTSDVALTFRISESASWIGYSLDGKDNVTANVDMLVQSTFGPLIMWTGNLTLTELPTGSHSLTVYAKDEVGLTGVSDTIYFTITEEPKEPEESAPFTTTLIAVAVAVIVAVVSFGVVAYFVKFRKKAEKHEKKSGGS